MARGLSTPETVIPAALERARLPGGDSEAALAALEEHGDRTGHDLRLRARFGLWELTGEVTHLAEAHRMLRHLIDHAPEDCRETMIENVPLHRDIAAAWEELGA